MELSRVTGKGTSWREDGQRRERRLIGGIALIVLVAALAIGLSACGGGSSGSDGGSGKSTDTLRLGFSEEPLPNPAKALSSGMYNTAIFSIAYEPIFHFTPEGEVEPALATEWGYVNKGDSINEVFEFKLRKGARFSDGSPVTAAGVADWLTYFVDAGSTFSTAFGEDPKFEAVDDETVRVTLTAPNPQLPFVLSDAGTNAGFVLSPKAMENPEVLVDETAGAGPYMLDASQSVRGNRYTYVPNPKYYDQDAIEFEKVEVKIIADAASRLQTQISGQLDVTEGKADTVQAAEAAGLEVASAPFVVNYMAFDLVHDAPAPIKDVRVRQAINLAIDRKLITEALLGTTGTPTSSFIPLDYNPELEGYWEYDPEQAKKLLAEAGYEDGFTLEAYAAGTFEGPTGEPLIRAVAKNLAEVGVKLDITAFATEAEYSEAVFTFDAPITQLGQGIVDTPTIYSVFLAPKAPVNFYGNDPVVNKAYEEGLVSKDPGVPWARMWERFADQAYVIPVVATPTTYYVSKPITDVNITEDRAFVLVPEWRSE